MAYVCSLTYGMLLLDGGSFSCSPLLLLNSSLFLYYAVILADAMFNNTFIAIVSWPVPFDGQRITNKVVGKSIAPKDSVSRVHDNTSFFVV
jgi:hypothetical protein